MAEGWLRSLYGERFESLSAGVDPTGEVHPRAVLAMREAGVDISHQRSKDIAEFLPPRGAVPHLVISVCSAADESCPAFPAEVERWHWPFDDPHGARGDDENQMRIFREVRDAIHRRLTAAFGPPQS